MPITPSASVKMKYSFNKKHEDDQRINPLMKSEMWGDDGKNRDMQGSFVTKIFDQTSFNME